MLSSTRWFRKVIMLPVVDGDWREIKEQVMMLLEKLPRRELLLREQEPVLTLIKFTCEKELHASAGNASLKGTRLYYGVSTRCF